MDTRSRHPWRQVLGTPKLRTGRGSVLGPDTSRRTAWWDCQLECGHIGQPTVRYLPLDGIDTGRGQVRHRSKDPAQMHPPPRKIRCEQCAPV